MEKQESEAMQAGQTQESKEKNEVPQQEANASGKVHSGTHKGGIHNNALFAASMGRAATAQVNPHRTDDLANTGTNVWYEGATAPGAGGSAGTGYTSGQAGTGASITSPSDYDEISLNKHEDTPKDQNEAARTGDATEKP